MRSPIVHVLNTRHPVLKICDIKNLEIAYNLYLLGVEAIGVHIWRKSLRNKIKWHRKKDELHDIIEYIGPKMLVFLLTDIYDYETLLNIIKEVGKPTVVQLQGYAEPQVVNQLSRSLHILDIYVAKTLSTSEPIDHIINYLQKIVNNIDIIVFDREWYGGTGKESQFEKIKKLKETINIKKPIMVSGGITQYNLGKVLCMLNPHIVDVESHVYDHINTPKEKNRTKKVINLKRVIKLKNIINSYKYGRDLFCEYIGIT